eukprot:gnl/MRDRNA2_/MRDRNA2_66641_c0_seq2.p1 gnl/MRDRNA2_/MRDRNA2_66641_c0~~gnl/MRDRNA2_/MRDRNA2_66641_c0_seq2.p1  ORF type:complete len:525 (-),score=97.86 gnl/MRDRNA2_/MRDRNA2_66641_c0_seq2:94-1668(-)
MGCGASSAKSQAANVPQNVEARPSPMKVVEAPDVKEGGLARHNFVTVSAGNIDDFYATKNWDLGAGGYGSVRKGVCKATGVQRAIKSIPKKSLPDRARFDREVEVMRILDHPNIIKLFEVYEDAKFLYMVMELCSGGELFDCIIEEPGGLSEKVAAKVAREVVRAVHYMHTANVAHRDLKPANILLVDNSGLEKSALKVIDFGLSRQCKPGEFMTTKACTLQYVAPEIMGVCQYTPLCDIWSLGVIIYIMLCGTAPFTGTNREIYDSIKSCTYSFEGPEWSTISSDAKDLISSMLILDPDQRFTAEQVLHHVWIENLAPQAKDENLLESRFNNLKAFTAANKLKKATLTVIAQQLEEGKIKDLKEMFDALDTHDNGTITVDEMGEAIRKLDLPEVWHTHLSQIMEHIDTTGNGVIDYTEFVAAALDKKMYLQEDLCWSAFRVFDIHGNGRLTKDELAKMLGGGNSDKECEEVWQDVMHIDRMEIERILKDHDADGDGAIDFDEFMVMMRKCPDRPSVGHDSVVR